MANKVFVGVAFSLSRAAIGLDNLDPVDVEEIPTPLSPHATHFRPFAVSTPFSVASPPLSIMDFLGRPEEDPTSAHVAPTDGAQTSSEVAGDTTAGAAAAAASTRFSQHKINQTLTSFAIVFALSDAAPPCVLSHYTELARRTGVQLRRAELFWQYLSAERDRVVTLLDSQAGIVSSPEEASGNNSGIGGGGGGTGGASLNGPAGSVALTVKEEDRGEGSANANDFESAAELPESETSPPSGGCGGPEALAGQVFALVAKRSPLCSELQHIVESVTSVGRVNIAIKGRYPVFFCLPYKAYAILPVGQPHLMPNWPAVRPRAVWQAMEKMRPYHTLLLTTQREELLSSFLPPDANRSLASFIKELSPTVGLNDLSVGMHSQGHCLRLALWLVYNGHAIIAYPVAGNNSYTLAPLSHLWLQPQLLLEFAERFPHLNLAQVLSSFADFQTLKSHLFPDTDSDQRSSDTRSYFWENIDIAESVELISWLLRRRLIIQLHTYVIPVLSASTTNTTPDAGRETVAHIEPEVHDGDLKAGEVAGYAEDNGGGHEERATGVATEESHVREETCHQQQCSNDMTAHFFIETHPDLTESLLEEALPNPADRHAVMTHYRNSVRDPALLCLFLRILPQLPAHLEDLIFVESVDRETLVLCIENFSPFLTTTRLPDPVTACFAGIEWPS
ncbi:hypothetical protein AAHC03_09925 [Spirometra sp. Aus1]